jgi:polysaccharide chain length determinant protein (PEP-CTERM system associated)
MENTPAFHPLDYVSVLRRRIWWLVTPLVLALIVGAALVMWLPRTYKTSATIGVSSPSVTASLVGGEQRVTPEDRMRSIQQVLLNRQVLERVVREESLAGDADAVGRAVAELRGSIEVAPRRSPNVAPDSFEQFTIAYTSGEPDLTQRVTNRLADVFVEESSRSREVRAEETSAFIRTQLQRNQDRLSDVEARLQAAKASFMGALPEQTNANVAMATGLQQQLESTANAIRGEQDRLSVIERQLETMRAGVNAAAVPGGAAPAVASPAALRVVELERQLEVARGLYTDKHPEIVKLRGEIEAARAAVTAETNRPQEDRVASLQIDPNYRALTRDAEQARLRIAGLQREESQIRGRIGMYQARVESAPRVEQQIATLQREYDLERQQYAELTTRLRNAEMAENLERNRGSERFTVLSRAGFPSVPFTPNTQRLMMVAVLLGICLGGGLALGREYLDRSVHDARTLNDLDLPVLGEIPRIANA